jgi:phenylalanyl-tRNA synthetase beta chain
MGQVAALFRVADLLHQSAAAREEGSVVDYDVRPPAPREITLDPKKLAALLGVEIPAPEVRRRLLALGATVKKSAQGKNLLSVVPPPYRSDLNEPADLAEEVARLTGLQDIPAQLPARQLAYSPPNREREFFRGAREIVQGAGFTEMDTLAFTTPADNDKFAGITIGEPIRVQNPLSEELRQMRRSIVPALIEALRFNLNRQAADFHAFEMAKVYSLEGGAPVERVALAALSYGDYALAEVGKPAIKASFFTMKGVLEVFLGALGLGERVSFRPPANAELKFLHPGRAAKVMLDDGVIGYLGELHPREAMERDLGEPCVVCELDLEKLKA